MTDNITLPRATVQQVLKTLEGIHRVDGYPELQPAVTALKAALGHWDIGEDNPDSLSKHPAFRRAPQQQAEPVACGGEQEAPYIGHDCDSTLPDTMKVFCPACCTKFRAIPTSVQKLLLDAGFEPPFTAPPQQQAEPVQEPFDDLATELFVVAQISPADDGFSDTIDRIESWLREHFSTPPQRKPLTDELEAAFKDGWQSAKAAHGIKDGV